MNNECDTECRLNKLFIQLFDGKINFEVSPELKNESLMGFKLSLEPRDVLCVFFEIEKEFKIKIPQEPIIEHRFDTFNKILSVVSELVPCNT